LSGVLVKPTKRGRWKENQRVNITLGIEGAYQPRPYQAFTGASGYKPKPKAQAGYRTLGLIAGEVDSSRPELYSAQPLFFDFQLEGLGFPCGGYRAVITEPVR
jgi:hypothetical protein